MSAYDLFLSDQADGPVASHSLLHDLLFISLLRLNINRLSQQGSLLRAHAPPNDPEQGLRKIVVPALAAEALRDQHQCRPQGFKLGHGRVLVDGINALETGKHERDNDEEIHGLEAVAEIV